MNNKNFDIYIDYGSSKIRAAAFSKNDPKDNFYCESSSYLNHKDSSIEIEKIISNLEKNTDEYLDTVNLMIDGPKIQSISLSLFKTFDGSKLKNEDVQFMIQDAKQQVLRNYISQNILHIIIKNYSIDNEDYSYLPSDIDCNSLSIDIMFICLSKKTAQDLKIIFSKFDISIKQIFCSSYTKSLNYKNNFISNKNLSFIDIGFNKTSVICYNNNQINFFQIIPVGSNHITKDISKILNLDLVKSEEIKLFIDKDERLLDEKEYSLDLAKKIISSRLEEIFELCANSIQLNESLEALNKSKIVLMGEGSKILDNKFIDKISFLEDVDFLEETMESICDSALKLRKGSNKQEVVIIPKKQINVGFFEKLFHFFR